MTSPTDNCTPQAHETSDTDHKVTAHALTTPPGNTDQTGQNPDDFNTRCATDATSSTD